MSERKCPVCAAPVDENKAFCPECGAPMDQEEKREVIPEIGAMTKTFNLNADEYQQMLREMNLSTKPEENFQKTQTVVIAPETVRELREEYKAKSGGADAEAAAKNPEAKVKSAAPIAGQPKKAGKSYRGLITAAILLTIIIVIVQCILLFLYGQEILGRFK